MIVYLKNVTDIKLHSIVLTYYTRTRFKMVFKHLWNEYKYTENNSQIIFLSHILLFIFYLTKQIIITDLNPLEILFVRTSQLNTISGIPWLKLSSVSSLTLIYLFIYLTYISDSKSINKHNTIKSIKKVHFFKKKHIKKNKTYIHITIFKK